MDNIKLWILVILIASTKHINATGNPSIDLSNFYNFNNINLYLSKQKIVCYHDSGQINLSDQYIIINHDKLFNEFKPGQVNNVAKDSKTVLWMHFKIDTILAEDHIIKCFPYYKKITFYYYAKDSVLNQQTVGTDIPFSNWEFKSNMHIMKIPQNSLNSYFLKFELYNSFPIGAFHILNYKDLVNFNFYNFVIYTSLLSCIVLMVILAVVYAFLNSEMKNIYYGLYAFFFGAFTLSSYHLWPMLTTINFSSHSYHIYYIPFSLSTIFFALYILKTFQKEGVEKNGLYILNTVLLIKTLTIIFLLININIENWVLSIFDKLDVVVYAILTYFVIIKTIKRPTLSQYWLLFGLIVILISQFLHIFYNLSHWIFIIMFLDIIWFGIGLSIENRITKMEKIKALEDIIIIKNDYNKNLEDQVKERTSQLNKNLETIENLNRVLRDNNITLIKNMETLEHDRILNKELNLEEFKAQFPDKESCLKLLSILKWKGNFICHDCCNTHYFLLKKTDPYLRKCTQCGKIQSATTNTLFHNVKFPLEKAFYITFLATSNKKYSLEEISESIDLRAATVWSFKKKVENAMEEKKFAKNKNMTWQDLIM